MSEKKNMTGKENSFHMENFRRRSRYAAVFLVLILAFAAITVLNIVLLCFITFTIIL